MFGPLSFTWKMWVKFQGAGSSECGHVGSGVADVKVCLSISLPFSLPSKSINLGKNKKQKTRTQKESVENCQSQEELRRAKKKARRLNMM